MEGAYGKAYKIQTSTDGKTWKTVKNVTNGKGGEETVAFNSTDARYVRMQGVERALPYGYSLWEMEVYGKFQAQHQMVQIMKIHQFHQIQTLQNQLRLHHQEMKLMQWQQNMQ